MLSAHYRSPLNFSAELMEAAKNGLERIVTAAEHLKFLLEGAKTENMTEKEQAKIVKSSKEYLQNLLSQLVALTDVLGIIVEKEQEMLADDIEALIAERQAARKERNFARADEIRDELLAKGIILEDTREGVKWKRA